MSNNSMSLLASSALTVFCEFAQESYPGLTPQAVKERLEATKSEPPPPLLTVDEVAAWFNLTTRTVYNLLKAGKLEKIKIGRSTRISRASAEAYLNQKFDKSK